MPPSLEGREEWRAPSAASLSKLLLSRHAYWVHPAKRAKRLDNLAEQLGYTDPRFTLIAYTKAVKRRAKLSETSRRLGGVATQRPAKPFTPVRFR
jgi:hypothetical protein